MSSKLDCTLIIPSHNRHKYLERVFEYYSSTNFYVVCCDSSENKYDGFIPNNIKYFHCFGLSFREKMFKAISQIDTKYVVCCADDDFIIKKSIQQGIYFLNLNQSYNCTIGKYIGFLKPFNNKFYQIYRDRFYTPTDDKVLNMKEFMSNYYMILWGLYRRSDILRAYEIIVNSKFRNDNFLEFIIGSFLSYSGNIKCLDCIWGVREIEFVDSWGKRYKNLCTEDSNVLQSDFDGIRDNFDLATEKNLFQKSFESYMKFCNPCVRSIKTTIFDSLPKKLKMFLYKIIKKPFIEDDNSLLEISKILDKYGK